MIVQEQSSMIQIQEMKMVKGNHTCPYCKSNGYWFIHTSGKEQVYQCADCMKYFKVPAGENARYAAVK